jgi:ribosomal protein S28E/S33
MQLGFELELLGRFFSLSRRRERSRIGPVKVGDIGILPE